jgi:hypothetical protein
MAKEPTKNTAPLPNGLKQTAASGSQIVETEKERRQRERREAEAAERERERERERLEREKREAEAKAERERRDALAKIWHTDEAVERYNHKKQFRRFKILIYVGDVNYTDASSVIAEYIFKARSIVDHNGNVIVDYRVELENHIEEIAEDGYLLKTDTGAVYYPPSRITSIEAIDLLTIPGAED